MRKVHVGAEADGESRTLLKTLATGARRSQFWSHSPQFESVRRTRPGRRFRSQTALTCRERRSTDLESVLAHNSGAVGPASAAGLTLTARPPHAGPPGQTPMSDRLRATPILLTQLLTTDLDEHGQRGNCQVAA